LLLALLAAPAAADVPIIPGTGGDPLVGLTLLPETVDAPLYPGLAMRGLEPENTRILLDGFEVPLAFHGEHGLRSTIMPDAITSISDDASVEYGGGSSFVELASRWGARPGRIQLTDADLTYAPQTFVPMRGLVPGVVAMRSGNLLARDGELDGTVSLSHVHGRWREEFTDMVGWDSFFGSYGRLVARSRYANGPWSNSVAVSPSFSFHTSSFDGRADIARRAPAAGLSMLTWRAGIETTNVDDFDTRQWRNDVAAWSSAAAKLSAAIVARGGVRVDLFDMRDVATQPRGSIEAKNHSSNVKLEAGAYRRAPRAPFDGLHPERTTQIVGTVQHNLYADDESLLGAQLVGFYIDRTHLVARDASGNWGNGGAGTAKGLELRVLFLDGPWQALLGVSVSSSVRRDYPRGRERFADFDQPLRIDSLVRYVKKRWSLGARLSLSSGLPYTPIVETTFDSDADTYIPVYGFTNSARLPWMHSLDLRADTRLGKSWSAFVELRNAYAASTALGYQYSFDYKQRLDVTLPILPFVGLRADLPVPRRYPPSRPTPAIAEASR
jgi:hypothetical protein